MLLTMLAVLASMPALLAADAGLRGPALLALRRGVEFFNREVSVRGTYLWQYSEDLAKREGEGRATATQGWVQPPGTPAVGMALLEAYEATGDKACLEAATNTAYGLIHGQLQSGGWAYHIDFDPKSSRPLAYLRHGPTPKKARRYSILDDDTTTAALRFLMRMDRVINFQDTNIHQAVSVGLESVLAAQRPAGGFPQVYEGPVEREKYPVKAADYPADWPRTHPGGDYHLFHTLNDNVLANVIETLWEARGIYQVPAVDTRTRELAQRCRVAVEKAGDFILLAQMPEPQPAWAQQYNFDMQPAWARKFEPPAVTGGESQGILRTLMKLYRWTGEKKYLEPMPRALAYLERSRLPNGQLARFYELRTNRPLYFTLDYQLTYQDGNMPTHYAFKVADNTPAIRREFETLQKQPAPLGEGMGTPRVRPRPDAGLEQSVRVIIQTQDPRGRWVEDGRLRYHGADDPTRRVIRCETFIRNITTLARFLEATQSARE